MVEQYTISVSNTFDAESIADAVDQMVSWLDDYADYAGYRVSWDEVVDHVRQERSVFVDAELLWRE